MNPALSSRNVVVSLCDRTGIMVHPWAQAGYECWCVDVQHSIRNDRVERVGEGLIHFVWGDVRSWRLPSEARGRVAMAFAFPPCTDLAVSGARDFQKKAGWALADALQLFDAVEVAFTFAGVPYMVENPVGRLSSHRRPPDHIFQPWQYGDPWCKKTCLWAGNGFVMPEPIQRTKPEGVTGFVLELSPSEDRANLRSETPPGFARAVFAANYPLVSMR